MDEPFDVIAYIRFHFRQIFWKTPPPEPILGPPGQAFPLADLPLIPLLVVIQNMDIRTILSLSAQSTKFKNIAKLHTRKMETHFQSAGRFFSFVDYEEQEDYPCTQQFRIGDIQITPEYMGRNEDWWNLVWNTPNELLRINGCPFYFHVLPDGSLEIRHGTWWRCLEEVFPDAIYHFLLDMFMGQPFDADLSVFRGQFPPLLCLDQPFRRICLVQAVDDLLVAPKILERALKDLTITEKLFVSWKVPAEFKYTKGLRYPKMVIRNAHWLTLESILHMKCVHLDAKSTLLTDHDVNRIIKKVIEGGFDGLDRIILGNGGTQWWTESVLLEGINWKSLQRWNSMRRYVCEVEVTGKNGRRISFGCNSEKCEIVVLN